MNIFQKKRPKKKQKNSVDTKEVVLPTAGGAVACVDSQGRLALHQRIVLPPKAAHARASLSQLLLRRVRQGRYRRCPRLLLEKPNEQVAFR